MLTNHFYGKITLKMQIPHRRIRKNIHPWLELDPKNVVAHKAVRELPAKIEERNEKLKAEMMDNLKKLGNMCLKPFGLSTNNFKMEQNESGSYNIQFQQNP